MSHKRKHTRQISDSDSQSAMSSEDSQLSFSSSSESQLQPEKKLSKKDLKKLIKLEKQIKEEKKLLKQIKSKIKQNKSLVKKTIKREQVAHSEIKNEKKNHNIIPTVPESKKLFITGIEAKYSHEEVTAELRCVIQNLKGVTAFRIKRKQGCPTYAFLDCQSKQKAKDVMEKLRKIKIFGGKLPVYYSQDQKKQPGKTQQSRKKCFQCNSYGHFARECYLRKKQNSEQEQKPIEKINEPIDYQGQISTSPNVKLEYIEPSPAEVKCEQIKVSQRVVRDKSRLSKLAHLN